MAIEKVKFYWKTMLGSTGSTLTAGSTASGYAVANIYSILEINSWKANNTASPVRINLDLGSGNSATADYLSILGHNLASIGATIVLQHSTTGAWAGEEVDCFTPFAPTADTVILKDFAAPSVKRYWSLKISGSLSAAPELVIAIWGEKTELKYAMAEFDPYEQEIKANVLRGPKGHVLGVFEHYRERSMSLRFNNVHDAIYQKLKEWWDGNGLKNFFVAWDRGNHPDDVFLMMPDPKFRSPFNSGGTRRTVNLSLTGRREDV